MISLLEVNRNNISKQKGFSLVELLVTMAIMSLLFTTVFSLLNAAQERSRDNKRLTDLRRIQLALETYYDTYGHYPDTTTSPPGVFPWSWSCFTCTAYSNTPVISNPPAASISAALLPFLRQIPSDPKNPWPGDGGYLYSGNETSYCLMIHRSPENMNNYPREYWNNHLCKNVDANGQCGNTSVEATVFVEAGTTYDSYCTATGP